MSKQFYMACVDVEGRACVVVGDGGMAAEKAEGLESCGALVDRVPAKKYKRRVLKALALSDETLFNQRTLRAFDLSKGKAQSGLNGLIRDGEVVQIGRSPVLVDPLLERWIQVHDGGPSTIAPASAATPPIACTTPDPAKSTYPWPRLMLEPSLASQPPPQVHAPNNG